MSIQRSQRSRSALTPELARRLLLGGDAADVLDRLARLAALALRTPVTTVGVIEQDRIVLASQMGVPEPWASACVLPLDATFCRHVHDTRELFLVEDAARHPLAYKVAWLENFPRVAYCGAPLLVQGETIAVLSAYDVQPRRWTADDVTVIGDLAASVLRDLELLAERTGAGDVAADAATLASGAPVSAATAGLAPDALVAVDGDWRLKFANERAQALLGRDEDSLLGHVFWELFPGLVGTLLHHECLRMVSDRTPIDLEDFCESLGGWVEVRGYPSADGGASLHLRDVSARRSAQDELRGREARYHRLFEDSSTPLFVMAADGTLLEMNRACEQLLGRPRTELYRMRLAELAVDPAVVDRVCEELAEQGTVKEAEVQLQRDGHAIICLLSAGAQATEQGISYHASLRDVTADRLTQEELIRSALHDAMTSLPNRVVLMDRLERLLKQTKRRSDYRFAVMFLDLDNFKAVNDTHGHHFGDQLLIAVARRLEACVRQEDTVARIGGDEFAILLDTVQDAASVIMVADRIRESLVRPFTAEGSEYGTSASIGIAVSASGYEHGEDLLRDADAAMYRAKASGRDDYVIFDSDMHARALAQRELEADLRSAVTHDQLAVHYHPVVELDNGSVTGLEALIRWSHPERGILLPAEFMPLAEQTGVIVEMGWWVLREACRQLRAWQLEYPDAAFSLTMSVNISEKQFVHPALVEQIDRILAETELDAHCLRLDLTEAVVMQNAGLAARLLQQLRERGIQICLDDFGTGYSSLQQLREFPISTFKIDRSFIGRLSGDDADGHEIVQTIIALGRSMAIDAVAEGVETPEQLEQLRRLGTRFAQGFLFSLPLDGQAATTLLADGR